MVKLLVSIAGPDFSHAPGEKVSLNKELERRLIESGQAEPVTQKRTTKKESAE
jgi:hypothetical protein